MKPIKTLLACIAVLACAPCAAEVFIDVGIHSSTIKSDIANRPDTIERSESGVHVGIGARRNSQNRGDFGVRVELDDLGSTTMLSVRALDYRRHITSKLAVTAFLGAARLSLATPAYGYYLGGGIQWQDIFERWDLSLEARHGDKIARDNLLPSDPQGGRPDNFHDVSGVSLFLSRRF